MNTRETSLPLSPGALHMPSAGHNFCMPCLSKKYGGIADEVDAGAATGRSLRVRKTLKPCPTCKVTSGVHFRSSLSATVACTLSVPSQLASGNFWPYF